MLGVALRNLLVARKPVYALGKWACEHDPQVLGLKGDEIAKLNHNRITRALDRLRALNFRRPG